MQRSLISCPRVTTRALLLSPQNPCPILCHHPTMGTAGGVAWNTLRQAPSLCLHRRQEDVQQLVGRHHPTSTGAASTSMCNQHAAASRRRPTRRGPRATAHRPVHMTVHTAAREAAAASKLLPAEATWSRMLSLPTAVAPREALPGLTNVVLPQVVLVVPAAMNSLELATAAMVTP